MYKVVNYSSSHHGVYKVVNYSIVIVKCHGMRLLVIMECMRLLTVYLVVTMECMRLTSYIVVIVECHGMSLLVIMECMRLLTIVILESIRLLTMVVIMKCMRLLIHYQKLVAALLEYFIDISYCIAKL